MQAQGKELSFSLELIRSLLKPEVQRKDDWNERELERDKMGSLVPYSPRTYRLFTIAETLIATKRETELKVVPSHSSTSLVLSTYLMPASLMETKLYNYGAELASKMVTNSLGAQ